MGGPSAGGAPTAAAPAAGAAPAGKAGAPAPAAAPEKPKEEEVDALEGGTIHHISYYRFSLLC